MADVTRFTPTADDGQIEMVARPDGEYVRYCDFSVLTAELAIARGYVAIMERDAHDLRDLRDLQAARIKVLEDALVNLDRHLDFGEPIEDNIAITFENASGINAAFTQACAAIAVESEGSEVEP